MHTASLAVLVSKLVYAACVELQALRDVNALLAYRSCNMSPPYGSSLWCVVRRPVLRTHSSVFHFWLCVFVCSS